MLYEVITLQWPGTPLFPEGMIRSRPQADITVEASRSRQRTELAFVGQGMTWEAVYQVVLGAGSASVSGVATVASQAMRVDTAEVQLVAGSIRRARQGAQDGGVVAMEMAAMRAAAPAAPAAEEAVGEAHVYTLPDRIVITSYSIHYTKLYDHEHQGHERVEAVVEDQTRGVGIGRSGERRRVGQEAQPGIAGEDLLPARRHGDHHQPRITSYNVCYTKLLRIAGGDALEDGDGEQAARAREQRGSGAAHHGAVASSGGAISRPASRARRTPTAWLVRRVYSSSLFGLIVHSDSSRITRAPRSRS